MFAKRVRLEQLVQYIMQVVESLTRWFRRANTKTIPSLVRTGIRNTRRAATKVRVGIVLPHACAALPLAIRVATRLDRILNVEHTVAFLVGRTLCFVAMEVLARFRH